MWIVRHCGLLDVVDCKMWIVRCCILLDVVDC